jgi:hypothetical protein
MNKESCLSLLSNAGLVWNTIKIGNIVGQLRAAGEQIDDADLFIPSGSPPCDSQRYLLSQSGSWHPKAGETK